MIKNVKKHLVVSVFGFAALMLAGPQAMADVKCK